MVGTGGKGRVVVSFLHPGVMEAGRVCKNRLRWIGCEWHFLIVLLMFIYVIMFIYIYNIEIVLERRNDNYKLNLT